ncbi:MAG: hypothetical protein WCE30_22015, partial [Mycobacterium sp.]
GGAAGLGNVAPSDSLPPTAHDAAGVGHSDGSDATHAHDKSHDQPDKSDERVEDTGVPHSTRVGEPAAAAIELKQDAPARRPAQTRPQD